MKKIMFILTTILAAMLFTPQASALPLFARQTGMECSACHYQHFPMLNAFGRAFKINAFNMMGIQGKVDGDRLSIPSNLNMAGLTTLGYERTNAADAGSSIPGTRNDGNGTFYTPGHSGELSLFFGGRINENAGFLTEVGLLGPANQNSAKMPVLFEVADSARAGIVPFTTNAQGASYGFELLNTGACAVHQMSGVGGFNGAHTSTISAQQFIGTGAAATGYALVASNSTGFINLTKYNQLGTGDLRGGNNTSGSGSIMGAGLDSTYLRAAGFLDLAGWEAGVGIQSWSGSSLSATDLTAPLTSKTAAIASTNATAIDGQLQGDWRNMPIGLYASYATAPATTITNSYNIGTLTRSAFNISGEVGVLPGIATVGAAIRRGLSGIDDGSGTNATDNAIMMTATYKLSQNMMASLSYTIANGSYWSQINPDIAANPNKLNNTLLAGSKTATLNLFTLF